MRPCRTARGMHGPITNIKRYCSSQFLANMDMGEKKSQTYESKSKVHALRKVLAKMSVYCKVGEGVILRVRPVCKRARLR